MSRRPGIVLVLAGLALLVLSGCSDPNSPQGFWARPRSDFAADIQWLFEIIAWAAAAVFVVVQTVLIVAIIRFRRRRGAPMPAQVHGHTKLEILWTILPAVVLAFVAVPTVRTIFASYHPQTEGTIQVEVIGRQFWWEFRYPQYGIVTANEVHFPAGTRVTLTLESADVLHEFWLPQLGGKRQVVPNSPHEGGYRHINELWWTANTPGIYYGQCTQLCGMSHANMRMRAIVHDAASWEAWLEAQQSASGQPINARVERGYELVTAGACAGCHTIADTPAQGVVGPNLTRLGARLTIAAGMLENNEANLIRWLKDPEAVKPGNRMPNLGLSDQDAAAIAAYLLSLR